MPSFASTGCSATPPSEPQFAALLDYHGTLLAVCGQWQDPQEARSWATELVQAGYPVAVRAILPAARRPADLAALFAVLAVSQDGGVA